MDEKIALFCREFKENFGFDSRFMIFEAKVISQKRTQYVEVITTEGHFCAVMKKFYKLYFDNVPVLKMKIKVLPYQELSRKFGIGNAGVSPLYKSASNRSEQVSQIIIGELFDVLEISPDEEWYRIRLHIDGYIGWVNRNPVKLLTQKEVKSYQKSNKVEITKKFVDIHSEPDKKSAVLRGVFLGAELPVTNKKKDWIEVRLPDSVKGWMNSKSCREVDTRAERSKDILKYAEMLYGVPYVWGGRSPFGIDCSAMMQLVYKMCGYRIPRDSNMQAALGIELGKNFNDYKMGDLLFFGNEDGKVTHVAIYTGKDMDFIHASGFVKTNSLNKKSGRFDERLGNMFFGARRIINI